VQEGKDERAEIDGKGNVEEDHETVVPRDQANNLTVGKKQWRNNLVIPAIYRCMCA
jgi:hypothetical protein